MKMLKKTIFKVLAVWLFLIILNFAAGFNSFALAEEKIVAIVNNEIVTQKDLDDFLHFTQLQLSREYKGKELETRMQSLKIELLNKLIEDRLILQEAKKNNITVDASRIKGKINEIKKRYNSEGEFEKDIARQGLTQADIEKKIREQFLMFSILEQKVRSNIIIKPLEVTEFYENNKNEFSYGEERELEAITLENEDLARTLAYNLKVGEKLESLAARYPLVVNRMKVNKAEQLKKEIENIVFKLQINEISEPVAIDNKYYVFRLINITPPKESTLAEAQDKVHNYLFDKKMTEELNKWLEGLKKQAYIKII